MSIKMTSEKTLILIYSFILIRWKDFVLKSLVCWVVMLCSLWSFRICLWASGWLHSREETPWFVPLMTSSVLHFISSLTELTIQPYSKYKALINSWNSKCIRFHVLTAVTIYYLLGCYVVYFASIFRVEEEGACFCCFLDDLVFGPKDEDNIFLRVFSKLYGFDSRWGHWIFSWLNPSSRTMVLGSTQPLTEISTRNLFSAG
jgi:hypothetical protein